MSQQLQTLKKADNIFQDDAVFGYIREMENELSLAPIPRLVAYCCLAFFYCQPEHFYKCSKAIQISGKKLIITKKRFQPKTYNNISYCNHWINSISKKTIIWKFKINGVSTTGSII